MICGDLNFNNCVLFVLNFVFLSFGYFFVNFCNICVFNADIVHGMST